MEYILMDTDGINCLVNQIGCPLGDTFVIADECIETLEQLLTLLKNENRNTLQVCRMLGLLELMENTLLPLIIHLGEGGHDEAEADKIFSLTCMLMMQLTLPLESLGDTNFVKLSAAVEIRKYKANFKRAALNEEFLNAFLRKLKSLLQKAEKSLSDVTCETVNNGLLYIRNILFIPVSDKNSDFSQRCIDLVLIQHLFQAGLFDIILDLGKMEHHFYWHSALIQVISLLYNDQNLVDDDAEESSMKKDQINDSDAVIVSPRQMSNYFSDIPSDHPSSPCPSPLHSPVCDTTTTTTTTQPSGDPCGDDIDGNGGDCRSRAPPGNINSPPVGQDQEQVVVEKMEEGDEKVDDYYSSSGSSSWYHTNPLADRIIHFETKLCLTYNELEVRQRLTLLSEAMLREGVFNNLVKALVTSCITRGSNALPDLYLSWFISYFLRFTQKLEIMPPLIRSCLSVEVVSYLTHVGVLTCEEIVANRRNGKADHLVLSRNHLAIHALRSILSALEHYWEQELKPIEEKFLVQFAALILQLTDLRYLFLMCIRNYSPCQQGVAYLRNVIITNHKYLIVAEHVLNSENVSCKFSMLDHIRNYASVDMMAKYGLLLDNYMAESPATLECIFTMMHHVAGDCLSPHTLLQLPILQTFTAILESNIELKQESSDLISYLFHKFLTYAETNPFGCASHVYQCSKYEYLDEGAPETDEGQQDLSESSYNGNDTMEWCQDDLDDLFVTYQRYATLPVHKQLSRVTEELSDKGINKSEKEVLNQLVQQGLIQENVARDLLETNELSPPSSSVEMEDMDTIDMEPRDTNWWHSLIDVLRSRGEYKKLQWLQQLFLEVCYVKIGGRNVGNKHQPEEPVALHNTIQNKPVPLVPFLMEQEKTLEDFLFCLTLEKLGLLTPDGPKQVYPRIPPHWSPQELLNVAKLLGPINFEEQKFSEADVNECVFKVQAKQHSEFLSSSQEQPTQNNRMNGQMSSLWHVFIRQCNITMRQSLQDSNAKASNKE